MLTCVFLLIVLQWILLYFPAASWAFCKLTGFVFLLTEPVTAKEYKLFPHDLSGKINVMAHAAENKSNTERHNSFLDFRMPFIWIYSYGLGISITFVTSFCWHRWREVDRRFEYRIHYLGIEGSVHVICLVNLDSRRNEMPTFRKIKIIDRSLYSSYLVNCWFILQVRGPKKHMKRLHAPKHWMLDKLGGVFVSITIMYIFIKTSNVQMYLSVIIKSVSVYKLWSEISFSEKLQYLMISSWP